VTAVIFYISGHGFGHASREVEIVNLLGARQPRRRIVLRTAANPSLLERTISVPYEVRPGACDTGIVQATSVTHDDEATVREAAAFYSNFDERVNADVRAFESQNVSVIVSDIAPLAFEVAERLHCPSIAIGNFTWDWIYETHPGFVDHAGWALPVIRQAYAKATRALELPFAGGFDVFRSVERLPLIARQATRSRRDTRAHFRIPQDRPAVLLSFGGYGMPALDVARVDCRDWTIVVTDRVVDAGRDLPMHVVFVEEHTFIGTGFRYEDLVSAVDVVMSKPGYGIVSECIACGTPLLYTSRGIFREYDLFVREMPRFLRAEYISHTDLFAGHWREALQSIRMRPDPRERLATDGAARAAAAIEEFLG
jgi:L-arabinokinase